MHRTDDVQNFVADRSFDEAVSILSSHHAGSIGGLEITGRLNREIRMLFAGHRIGDRGIGDSTLNHQPSSQFALNR